MAHRIAHIDDDPDIRRAVRTILESEGYAVEDYASMGDFLKTLDKEQQHPSIAILDVMVEKEDSGLKAYDLLRTTCPEMPVVLLTSLGEMIRPYFEQEDPMVWIVEKPVMPEKLLSVVRSRVRESDSLSRRNGADG